MGSVIEKGGSGDEKRRNTEVSDVACQHVALLQTCKQTKLGRGVLRMKEGEKILRFPM